MHRRRQVHSLWPRQQLHGLWPRQQVHSLWRRRRVHGLWRRRPAGVARIWAGALAGALTLGGTLTLAGCGGTTHVDAPVLTVVTSLYPLAEAVGEVGGSQVHVIDLARPGVDPRTMKPTPAQVQEIHRAALMVDVGGGFQPAVESAASGARRQLSLLPALGGSNPYFWLDPALMKRVATVLSDRLTRAEPAGKPVFATGAEDLTTEASSLDIDFENSLSDCPDSMFVTSDDAFARMAQQYGVTDHPVGSAPQPGAATVRSAIAAVKASHAEAAFAEPYVNRLVISAAAQAAGVKLDTLNTLETPPASGSRAEVSYSNQMEIDLSTLTKALQCPSPDSN